jgi:hypothetical protein
LESGIYAPRLYGQASIHFADRKRKIDETRRAAFLVPIEPGMRAVDWDRAIPVTVLPDQLRRDAPVPAPYQQLPAGAMRVLTFTRWAKSFDRWLARTQRLPVPADPGDGADAAELRPKRGGVSVELVAIVWELV